MVAVENNGGESAKWASEGCGIGFVTSFGRKRVALLNSPMDFAGDDEWIPSTPPKRQCYEDSVLCSEKSALEAFPLDILMRILCEVEHDDLKSLFFVSKTIREATLIAKQMHFTYRTPKKTMVFRNLEDMNECNEIVAAPYAPRQMRVPRSRLDAKKLADLSVALFASDDECCLPRKDLSLEMDLEI